MSKAPALADDLDALAALLERREPASLGDVRSIAWRAFKEAEALAEEAAATCVTLNRLRSELMMTGGPTHGERPVYVPVNFARDLRDQAARLRD
jgi:hypothetical protein